MEFKGWHQETCQTGWEKPTRPQAYVKEGPAATEEGRSGTGGRPQKSTAIGCESIHTRNR